MICGEKGGYITFRRNHNIFKIANQSCSSTCTILLPYNNHHTQQCYCKSIAVDNYGKAKQRTNCPILNLAIGAQPCKMRLGASMKHVGSARSTPTPLHKQTRTMKPSTSSSCLMSSNSPIPYDTNGTIMTGITSSAYYGSPQEQDTITNISTMNEIEQQPGVKAALITNWLTHHVDMENSFVYNDNLWIYVSKDTLFEYDIKSHNNTNDTTLTGWKKHKLKPSDKHGFPCCSKEFKLVQHGDTVYLHGGINYRDKGFSRIWKLDLKLKKWRRIGDDSAEVYSTPLTDTSVYHNNQLVCLGTSFKGIVYRYSTIDGTQWLDKVDHAGIPARRFHTSLIVNDKMYVFGGIIIGKDSTATSQVAIYDLQEMKWQVVRFNNGDYQPRGRFGHSATLYQNKYIMIYGGAHSSKPFEYADATQIDIFDIETNKWTVRRTETTIERTIGKSVLPMQTKKRTTTATEPRTGHRTLVIDNRACVLGGVRSNGRTEKRVENITILFM